MGTRRESHDANLQNAPDPYIYKPNVCKRVNETEGLLQVDVSNIQRV